MPDLQEAMFLHFLRWNIKKHIIQCAQTMVGVLFRWFIIIENLQFAQACEDTIKYRAHGKNLAYNTTGL